MYRTGLVVVIAWGLLTAGCGHSPETRIHSVVRTVEITEHVMPQILDAAPGEEVRWFNLRSSPVRLGLLTVKPMDAVVCEKGFTTLFGEVGDLITIPPGQSVSLCFAKPTTVHYNVWLDEKNLKGSMTPTATIRINRR